MITDLRFIDRDGKKILQYRAVNHDWCDVEAISPEKSRYWDSVKRAKGEMILADHLTFDKAAQMIFSKMFG